MSYARRRSVSARLEFEPRMALRIHTEETARQEAKGPARRAVPMDHTIGL